MITNTLRHPLVEFFATSRMAPAYRCAEKQNKFLASHAEMRELGRANLAHDLAGLGSEFEIVVLSHADEEYPASTDECLGRMMARAFHLLFTEPTTHPGQVAHWISSTNIRSEDRLHVIKVEALEAPQVSQLLGRVCSALGRDGSRGNIIDAYFAGDTLLVRGPKHRMLHVPIDSVPALRGQAHAAVRNFEIDPDGSFIYWPDLDVHLGWNQFLQAVDPHELRKAEQRNSGFNERYGAAIRKLREQAGIPQSKVEGLTERHLRRIEQGENRATATAITALSKAHGLDPNAYMEALTQAME